MFPSAAVEAHSLAYNNGELRLLLLKSELQLDCFLNVDDTDTVILIFDTRTQHSNNDSCASDSTVGSRERNNEVAAADGRCRMGSGTPNCTCHEYGGFLVKLILPVMQHNVVQKVRNNVIWCLHGPVQDLTYPIAFRVITGIGVIARH